MLTTNQAWHLRTRTRVVVITFIHLTPDMVCMYRSLYLREASINRNGSLEIYAVIPRGGAYQ